MLDWEKDWNNCVQRVSNAVQSIYNPTNPPSSIQTKRVVKLLTHRNSDFFFNYLGSSKEKPYVVGIESCRRTLLFWVWISLIFYSLWNAPICKLISAAVIFCSECLRYAQNQKKQRILNNSIFCCFFTPRFRSTFSMIVVFLFLDDSQQRYQYDLANWTSLGVWF